jgi:predicted nucleic acid-binding Zn ribbon protein
MNLYVLAGLVVLAAIAFVVAPLVRRGRDGNAARSGGAPSQRESREAPRPSALDEIELDFAMGKLEKGEYETLRARYAHELTNAAVADPLASATADSPSERAEAMIRGQRSSGVACATCGPRPEPDARFCSTCGRVLRACPTCGAAIDETSGRYCTSCGSALAV